MDNIRLNIEELGAATEVSPEVRYAQIHRDLEKGLDSERLWAQLCDVCLRLGKVGEAARTLRHIHTPSLAMHLTKMLESHGVIAHNLAPALQQNAGSSPQPEASGPPGQAGGGLARLAQAPAPAMAGPRQGSHHASQPAPQARVQGAHPAGEEEEKESVGEELIDACRYLLMDPMPIVAIGFTMLFPLVAMGAYLIPPVLGSTVTLALRMLPVLMVAGVFFFCARRVLEEANQGSEEPIPVRDLMRDFTSGSLRTLGGMLLLLAVCLAPGVTVLMLELPWKESLVIGMLGVAYLPMAMLGVALSRNWDAALPGRVFRAMAVDALGTLKLIALTVLALALPALAVCLTWGGQLYLQVGLAGPMLVGPGLILARLLGRFSYAHDAALTKAFGLPVDARPMPKRRRKHGRREALRQQGPAPSIRRRDPAGRSQPVAAAGRERNVAANAPRAKSTIAAAAERAERERDARRLLAEQQAKPASARPMRQAAEHAVAVGATAQSVNAGYGNGMQAINSGMPASMNGMRGLAGRGQAQAGRGMQMVRGSVPSPQPHGQTQGSMPNHAQSAQPSQPTRGRKPADLEQARSAPKQSPNGQDARSAAVRRSPQQGRPAQAGSRPVQGRAPQVRPDAGAPQRPTRPDAPRRSSAAASPSRSPASGKRPSQEAPRARAPRRDAAPDASAQRQPKRRLEIPDWMDD